MFVLIEKPCIVQTGYIEVMLNQGLPTDNYGLTYGCLPVKTKKPPVLLTRRFLLGL